MRERDIVVRELQERLATWDRDVDELVAASERSARAVRQTLRELRDCRESARIKVEKTLRASDGRFDLSRRECEEVFARLRDAWDAALRRIASTSALRDD